MTNIELTRVDNDFYGNPRVVVHFTSFLNETDYKEADMYHGVVRNYFLFNIALSRAKRIGGKEYRGKGYRGGIVFQCWSETDLKRKIKALSEERSYTYKTKRGEFISVPECNCINLDGNIYKRLTLEGYEGILTLAK